MVVVLDSYYRIARYALANVSGGAISFYDDYVNPRGNALRV